MTLLPPGVKVHLALGYTDMRNYAECTIMLSAGRRTRGERGRAIVLTQHNFLIRWRFSALSGARREDGSGRVAATTEQPLSALQASPSGRRADRSRCSEGWRGQARARPCERRASLEAYALRSCDEGRAV